MFTFTKEELNNQEKYITKVREIISKNKPAYICASHENPRGTSGVNICIQFDENNDIYSEKFLKTDMVFQFYDYASLVEKTRNTWESESIEFLEGSSTYSKNEDLFVSLDYINNTINKDNYSVNFNIPATSISRGRVANVFGMYYNIGICDRYTSGFKTINVNNLNYIISKYPNIKQAYIDSVITNVDKSAAEIEKLQKDIIQLKKDITNFINHPNIILNDEDKLLLNVRSDYIYGISGQNS